MVTEQGLRMSGAQIQHNPLCISVCLLSTYGFMQ